MGLFDLFGGGGGSDKRQAKNIAKATEKLRNPHVQTQERQRMIEVMQSVGTPEAVDAILQRFTMRTPGAIVDEDEKRIAYESLLGLGEVAVEPIERFIRSETSIYWPLRAFTEIAGEERTVALILRALDEAEHGYDAETSRREQLVANLREFSHSEAARDRLVALTRDESVEVRILALDGLPEFEGDVVLNTLIERLTDEDEALRVKTTIVDILADRQLPVAAFREQVEANLPDLFSLDDEGIVRRK